MDSLRTWRLLITPLFIFLVVVSFLRLTHPLQINSSDSPDTVTIKINGRYWFGHNAVHFFVMSVQLSAHETEHIDKILLSLAQKKEDGSWKLSESSNDLVVDRKTIGAKPLRFRCVFFSIPLNPDTDLSTRWVVCTATSRPATNAVINSSYAHSSQDIFTSSAHQF